MYALKSQITLLTAAVAFSSAPVPGADSFTTAMHVTATVAARANVTVDSQPTTVDVTEEDIARGYIDVEGPLQWRGHTNSRRGYLLQVTKAGEAFTAVRLDFAGTEMNIAHESWVVRPYVPGGEALAVQARLILSASTRPGLHLVPISVSATPL